MGYLWSVSEPKESSLAGRAGLSPWSSPPPGPCCCRKSTLRSPRDIGPSSGLAQRRGRAADRPRDRRRGVPTPSKTAGPNASDEVASKRMHATPAACLHAACMLVRPLKTDANCTTNHTSRNHILRP